MQSCAEEDYRRNRGYEGHAAETTLALAHLPDLGKNHIGCGQNRPECVPSFGAPNRPARS